MKGYVALHRKLMESWVSDDPMALALWVRMLLEVTHKNRTAFYKGETYKLKKGAFLFGLNKWSMKTGIPREVLRKRVDMLESDGMITRQKHPHVSIITVSNWDLYQKDNTETPQQEHPNNTPEPQQQQQNNNGNNEDNGNNGNKKEGEKRKRFSPPTAEEVQQYMEKYAREKNLPPVDSMEGERFINYWTDQDWKRKGQKMKSWQGTARNHLLNRAKYSGGAKKNIADPQSSANYQEKHSDSFDEIFGGNDEQQGY